ncbi:MAG: preprotein translocase subunit SecA [Zetaproteobacteria bacterium]|mgnify:CR=1 FL=1|nr:preprotein translocase subunit SecA [Pseudobdellovibrionaceae bacterium]
MNQELSEQNDAEVASAVVTNDTAHEECQVGAPCCGPKKPVAQVFNMHKNLGRNDPCHCGSGKKYKKCCL